MQLIRTTVRLDQDLKKFAEQKALDENKTLQEIFNDALKSYLKSQAKKEAKEIIFKTHDLGEPLDNLTRDDIYGDPENVD